MYYKYTKDYYKKSKSDIIIKRGEHMKYMIKIALFLIILLLISFLGPVYAPALNSILGMATNIFVACGLAYVSYPAVKFLRKKGLNNFLASTITLLIAGSLIVFVVALILPLVYQQIVKAIEVFQNSSNSISWVKNNPDIRKIVDLSEPYFEKFGQQALDYIASSTQNLISRSTKFFADALIIVCLYIYILFDSVKIRERIKTKLGKGSKSFNFFKKLDQEFSKYLKGLIIIIIITVFEYGIIYYLIGHPDWMTLAALCAFSNLIPYFGGIIVNIIALLTAVFVSEELFFRVMICVIVLPTIEGNLLNPMIHKKTIKISPIVLLPSLFIGSALFGFLGIVLSIPAIILYKVFMEFYKEDTKNLILRLWHS